MNVEKESRQTRAKLRVRYAETDQMGYAYYANHLVWFEVARTQLLRERGMAYRDLEEQGLFLPVAEANIRYLSPVRYEDEVEVECCVRAVSFKAANPSLPFPATVTTCCTVSSPIFRNRATCSSSSIMRIRAIPEEASTAR